MKKFWSENEENYDIKMLIANSGLRFYDVAEIIGIHHTTLSSWLGRKLPPEKRRLILSAIKKSRGFTKTGVTREGIIQSHIEDCVESGFTLDEIANVLEKMRNAR